MDKVDELIWDYDLHGSYTPKLGYQRLIVDLLGRPTVWWWKRIWKFKCLAKTRLFMWCVLENKVPTWDVLQRRCFAGTGWCPLCKNELENMSHLFISCPFSVQVWAEVSRRLNHGCIWQGETVNVVFHSWVSNSNNRNFKALPLIILWDVWIARNKFIFQETPSCPEVIAVNSLSILSFYPQCNDAPRIRVVQNEEINKAIPWAYFDGASQLNNEQSGGGGVLFMSDLIFFELSMGFREGTNNHAELLALKFLLSFALEKGCNSLQVFGDSMLVLKWVRKTQRCLNTHLTPLLEEFFLWITRFDVVHFMHIYMEQNQKADQLSKAGLKLAPGQIAVTSHDRDIQFRFFHEPFREAPNPHRI